MNGILKSLAASAAVCSGLLVGMGLQQEKLQVLSQREAQGIFGADICGKNLGYSTLHCDTYPNNCQHLRLTTTTGNQDNLTTDRCEELHETPCGTYAKVQGMCSG